ncbi:MAG: hypothetical protein R3B07_16720 [Polyangiaceae bacterium]
MAEEIPLSSSCLGMAAQLTAQKVPRRPLKRQLPGATTSFPVPPSQEHDAQGAGGDALHIGSDAVHLVATDQLRGLTALALSAGVHPPGKLIAGEELSVLVDVLEQHVTHANFLTRL